MTLKEYLQKYYTDINDYAGIIDDTGDYSILHEIFFPNYGILNTNRLNEINYAPFIYENTPYSNNYYGGRIVYDISEYIGENYYDNNVNERFFKEPQSPELPIWTPIMHKIFTIMIRYRYKWHALYESMLLDEQYDPLDNVNEFYSESITRTPDLTYTDTNSNTYGEKEKNDTNEYGAKSTDTSATHGKQKAETSIDYGRTNESRQETIGKRSDYKETTYGETEIEKANTNYVYPYDVNGEIGYPKEGDSGNETTHMHTDSENNNIGDQMNSSTKTSIGHSDKSITNVDGYSDSNSMNESAHKDKLKSVENKHSDSFNGLKTESGKEETAIEIRRHGNIGVTKSTTLIEDFRKIHYFDLIKIMGNDIINEIFDLNFAS